MLKARPIRDGKTVLARVSAVILVPPRTRQIDKHAVTLEVKSPDCSKKVVAQSLVGIIASGGCKDFHVLESTLEAVQEPLG